MFSGTELELIMTLLVGRCQVNSECAAGHRLRTTGLQRTVRTTRRVSGVINHALCVGVVGSHRVRLKLAQCLRACV